MVDYAAWASADPLTVEQAAQLWAGIDPASPLLTQTDEHRAAVAPRLQMLEGAIATGALAADTSTNAFALIGDHKRSLVRREDLRTFAISRGERPAFLFDTSSKPVEAKPSAAGPAVGPAKNRGGNRAYNDDQIVEEVRRAVESGEAKSYAEAINARLSRIRGQSDAAKIERIRRKAMKPLR